MRTLEDMQRDYEIAKKELEPIEKEREKAVKKCNKLYYEIENYKLKNGLFYPMSDLEQHKGKYVNHIKLVVRDKNGELSTKDMYNDDMFNVDDSGHLHYSSYQCGVMGYSEEDRKYIYSYYGRETEYDFVGYLKADFEDDEESEETDNE